MKKITLLMLVLAVSISALAACGGDQEEPKTEPTPTSQTETTDNQEKVPAPDSNEEKTPPAQEETKTPPAQENQETSSKNQEPQIDESMLFSEGSFDGKFARCKLPDKWIAKEDPNQGYATVMLDPKQNAGLSIQGVENNKDPIDVIAQAIADQFKGPIEDYKVGRYSYKKIKTNQQGKEVDYLVCVIGSRAYFLASDILDQPATQELLGNIELK
jgi:hypothetical protein